MKQLCKRVVTLSLCTLSAIGFADDLGGQTLSRVNFQLTAQGWVTTQSADATVAVNAAITDQGLAARKQAILAKLQKLAPKAQWHLVSFDQSKDPSGLMRLSLLANARIAQSATNDLSKKLASVSRSGEQYKLVKLAFTPSHKEIAQSKAKLRKQLYRRVLNEMNTLKGVYHQTFYPQQIDFSSSTPRPMPLMLYKAANNSAAHSATTPAVANRLTLTANVTLAADSAHAAS